MQKIRRTVGASLKMSLLMSSALAAGTLPATYKFTPKGEVDALFDKFDSTTSPGCSAAVAKDGCLWTTMSASTFRKCRTSAPPSRCGR